MAKPQILLTNDDGIDSPGLWAAAEVLERLGYVHVVAPSEQMTSMGRSLPTDSDGIITPKEIHVNGRSWTVYAVGGTPAQAVLHGILEVMPQKPDLVVSGINYGVNVGTGVTISGTVGAAIEGAAMGVPALAASLETLKEHHLTHSNTIDFSAAAYFTGLFAEKMLAQRLPHDVDLLKIDVPSDATSSTEWRTTRIVRKRFYKSKASGRTSWAEPGKLDYERTTDLEDFPGDSDVYTTIVAREVSVTPMSIDMTSRVDLGEFGKKLRAT